MKVKFWGTRGSIPAPGNDTIKYGGNTTCLTINPDNDPYSPLIIDAGTGIRLLGDELVKIGKSLELTILFTHSHWDHIQGFPFFMPAYSASNRIDIYGCPQLGTTLKDSLLAQMDTRNFPITYDALKASINFNIFCSGNQMMGIEIITIKLNHPGSGVGFRFTKDKRSLIFLTDHELEDHPYIGASIKETIEFCRNADLLIHDAQYLKEEMPLHRGWGHSAFEDVVEMASEAGIKKLLFFHHDPIRTDAELDKILYEVNDNNSKRNIPLSCFAAREGEELVV